jgi:hypothetical protein
MIRLKSRELSALFAIVTLSALLGFAFGFMFSRARP